MESENKVIIVEPIETKTVATEPKKTDDSITNKYCWSCKSPTLFLRFLSLENDIGTVNICQKCEFEAEMKVIREEYRGNRKKMLEDTAKSAANKTKKFFGNLFKVTKDFLK